LLGSFHLLNNDGFETELNKFSGVFLQTLFGKTCVHFGAHELQIEVAVANGCVLVEQFVKFA
jgi:hypothetical protein